MQPDYLSAAIPELNLLDENLLPSVTTKAPEWLGTIVLYSW